MVQYMKISKYNSPYKETKRNKAYGHLISCKKSLGHIQHPFMISVMEELGIQGTYLILIKAIYSKPIANTKINGEKLKEIPQISRIK